MVRFGSCRCEQTAKFLNEQIGERFNVISYKLHNDQKIDDKVEMTGTFLGFAEIDGRCQCTHHRGTEQRHASHMVFRPDGKQELVTVGFHDIADLREPKQ